MTRHIPEHAKIQREFQDWEFGLTGYCTDNKTGIEALPSAVVQAWDDMNAAWNDIKDSQGNVSEEKRQRFREANNRLQNAWDAMTEHKTG
ncbi:hypothetical protein [Thalassospira mesophila]|uniref:Uncharacterized protein n=1 Tax=Thalassospira mesophila TaxID=1293891 RepID=A0A1Y2KXT6_9PROT|nr:hypothetical protein [Thalassospira mesophila]OSQ36116.1 hypothetical protein TMES_18755 [Thalassospira mesophila]